jgi:predicted DNA-binding transcriptional regulator AlpA
MNHLKTAMQEGVAAGALYGAASEADSPFLPARRVWERYGVTSMTLHRWLADERLEFPAPVYLGRFRYWRLCDLLQWEAHRPRHKTALSVEAA